MEDSSRPRPPLPRRRDKPQLSCHYCRRRKRRCDRGSPCGTCVKMGRPPSSCIYAEGTSAASFPDVQIERNDVANQLQRLDERLAAVQSAAATTTNDATTTNPTIQDEQPSSQMMDPEISVTDAAPYTLPPEDNPHLPQPGKPLVQPQMLRIDMDFSDVVELPNRHSNPVSRQHPFRYHFYMNPDAPVYHSIGFFPI